LSYLLEVVEPGLDTFPAFFDAIEPIANPIKLARAVPQDGRRRWRWLCPSAAARGKIVLMLD
jgi:hypothetical protein